MSTARVFGFKFADLQKIVEADELFKNALGLAHRRTIIPVSKLSNIFLLIRYYLPLLPYGDIIEIGSYRGRCALFISYLCRETGLGSTIFAPDTFKGMPETNRSVDLHSMGDFDGVNLDELIFCR